MARDLVSNSSKNGALQGALHILEHFHQVGDSGDVGHRLDAVLKARQLHRTAPLREQPVDVHQTSVGRGIHVAGFGKIHNQLPSSTFDELRDIGGKGAEQRIDQPLLFHPDGYCQVDVDRASRSRRVDFLCSRQAAHVSVCQAMKARARSSR